MRIGSASPRPPAAAGPSFVMAGLSPACAGHDDEAPGVTRRGGYPVRRGPWVCRLLLILPLAGCEGRQSVLNPIGTEADRIASMSWLLFIGGTAIFVLTMILVLLALGGGPKVRQWLASRRTILAGGVAFPLVVLTGLLVYTLGVTGSVTARGAEGGLRIEVTGKQFWWEVRYPAQRIITANEIHVPAGRPVELVLDSTDVIHSLWIPALHGKRDMIPGRVTRLQFTATEPGIIRGQCAEFCGAQHARMAFYVVVHPQDGFDAWIDSQRQAVTEPSDPFLAQGWRAFGMAGCGACHAIRGTPWTGRAGPDLTLIGSRLSLGAGTLDNHPATMAGWIAGPQALKPGNLMPPFNAVLEGHELRALAAWLESLK